MQIRKRLAYGLYMKISFSFVHFVLHFRFLSGAVFCDEKLMDLLYHTAVFLAITADDTEENAVIQSKDRYGFYLIKYRTSKS